MEICRVSLEKCTEEEVELLAAAEAVRTRAPSSLSGYLVGAAVRSALTGKIYCGCNIERLGELTTCAERVAIDTVIAAEGPRIRIDTFAVVAGCAKKEGDCLRMLSPVRWYLADLPVPCERCLRIIQRICGDDQSITILGANTQGECCRTELLGSTPIGSLLSKTV